MATDLKDTPTAGLDVQLCGDAHLSNFGGFASPERTLLFDLNDFDETLPGPFEYDVKRMAASFTIAARNNGFSAADATAATLASVKAYREAMAEFAKMGNMDIWYARLTEQEVMDAIRTLTKGRSTKEAAAQAKKGAKRAKKTVEKAHTRDSLQALSKLGEVVDGRYRIVSQPPVVIPARDLEAMYGYSGDELQDMVHQQFRAYRATLQEDRRHLLERFEIVDMARKVVGVGSVGTRAFIVLLQGRDEQDPLFLQVKEATASVLEDHLPKSRFKQPGERVVQGQRLMQAASDIYLGWTKGAEADRLPVLAPTPRHEGLGPGRADDPGRARLLRRALRMDPCPRPRPIGRRRGAGRISREERQVRPVDHRLLRALRRPERTGLPGIRRGDPDPDGSRPSKASELRGRPVLVRTTSVVVRCSPQRADAGRSNGMVSGGQYQSVPVNWKMLAR